MDVGIDEKYKKVGKNGGLSHEPEDVIARAIENYKAEIEIQQDNINMALDDVEFIHSDNQWDDKVLTERKKSGKNRPALTFNFLEGMMRIIEGDQLQNEITATVSPIDNINDPEGAKQTNAILYNIKTNSCAEEVYARAFKQAVEGGFGYMRFRNVFKPGTFNTEIKIEGFEDIASIILDSHYQEVDASDRNYGFVLEQMNREKFRELYPDVSISGFVADGWITPNEVKVAEYYERERKTRKLYLDAHGMVTPEDKIPTNEEEKSKFMELVVDERDEEYFEVLWYKLTATEILEGPIKIFGDEIPIVECNGIVVRKRDGVRIRKGIFHNSKSPQDMINYWKTAIAEYLMAAPKNKILATPAMVSRHVSMYKNMNNEVSPLLYYDRDAEFPGDKPTPIPPPQIPTGFTNESNMMGEDLKRTSVIFDTYSGAKSNETSGKAKLITIRRSDISTFLFNKHLKNAVESLYYKILKVIPDTYTYQDILRITGNDGKPEEVKINPVNPTTGKVEVMVKDAWKYDMVINVGPAYSTQREENADALTNAIQYSKDPLDSKILLIGAFKNSDVSGLQEIAKKLDKTLPLKFRDDQTGQEEANKQAQQQQEIQMKEIELKLQGLELENQQKAKEIENVSIENKQAMVNLQKMIKDEITAAVTQVIRT